MTIKLIGSSSGSVSLQAPASTSGGANRVLTLPDADATLATTSDSFGKILQVKTNTTRDSTGSFQCTPNETYVDIPYQNVTITPSSASNKILISFSQFGENNYDTHQYVLGLKRAISGGATTVIEGAAAGNRTQMLSTFTRSHGTDNVSTIDAAHCVNYLDSPNTTSAITYSLKIQFHTNKYSELRVQYTDGAQTESRSYMSLMELAG